MTRPHRRVDHPCLGGVQSRTFLNFPSEAVVMLGPPKPGPIECLSLGTSSGRGLKTGQDRRRKRPWPRMTPTSHSFSGRQGQCVTCSTAVNVSSATAASGRTNSGRPLFPPPDSHSPNHALLSYTHSCVRIVPEARACRDGRLVADEAVLVEVEDGELAGGHHVGVRAAHDAVPHL